jgi:hypothetical protein
LLTAASKAELPATQARDAMPLFERRCAGTTASQNNLLLRCAKFPARAVPRNFLPVRRPAAQSTRRTLFLPDCAHSICMA